MGSEHPDDRPGDRSRRHAGRRPDRRCVMNYHGYLILHGGRSAESTVNRLFDPWKGPLSTRFAATFVTVAGMGITLLTNRSRVTRRPATAQQRSLDADPPRRAALRVRVLPRLGVARHDPVLLRRASSWSARCCSRCAPLADRHRRPSPPSPPRHCSGGRSKLTATPAWLFQGWYASTAVPVAARPAVRHVRPRHASAAAVAGVPVRRAWCSAASCRCVGPGVARSIGARCVCSSSARISPTTCSPTRRCAPGCWPPTRSTAASSTRCAHIGSSIVAVCVIGWIAERHAHGSGDAASR